MASEEYIPQGCYPFDAIIQWPWLDMGRPGMDKQMDSFDIVGYGPVEVEIGYDQTNPGYFTDPYEVAPDTLRGTPVPMPVVSPTFSVRLRYRGMVAGGEPWAFNAAGLYFT